ncbi:MAG: extracellular catalytic domain type 1 short-chain-length polyhydroxyalkanoate depolymerase [Rhizomicrobium sp.]
MRTLGKTIASLARYRRQWTATLHTVAGPRPRREHASVVPDHLKEVTGFGSNPGALRMFTHVPAKFASPPSLVVVLHGCTQSAASYDLGAGWSTLADRYGFALLLPEQTPANNPKTCFNWFQPGDTARDRGEALSIRQMIARMIVDHGIDRGRVFITGLSAGGGMTSAMLAVYPEVFAAGAIIAGLPYRTAGNVQQAFESMFQGRVRSPQEWGDEVRHASKHRGPWPRVSVWHGDLDATVKPMNADSIVQQWANVHEIASDPRTEMVDGYQRQAWHRNGVDVIESYSITGMGHGTPLATGSSDQAYGEVGPFLLEVGISSSYHIAKFFGLTGKVQSKAVNGVNEARDAAHVSLVPDDRVEIIPDDKVEVLDAKSARERPKFEDRPGQIDVMSIITKALTSAGLMKPPV